MRRLTRTLLAAASLAPIMAVEAGAGQLDVKLTPLGSYREVSTTTPGACRTGISQIGAYDPVSRRLFVTDANPQDNALYILDIKDPAHPALVGGSPIHVADLVGDNFEPPGVAASAGLVALAVEAIDPVSAGGKVLLLDNKGKLLRAFDVPSGPERVAFSPDGRFIAVAVQGEYDEANAVDPKGGIAVIDLGHGIQHARVRFADFSGFSSGQLVAHGVRIGPDHSDPGGLNPAVRDLEPHSISVSPDSRTAFATLQLNNAVAVVDLHTARVTAVLGLGLKNHDRRANRLDASADDGAINIRRWPIWGAYLPDGIAAFGANGQTYLATANEGDTRDDADKVEDVALDPAVFPNAAALQREAALGGLEVSNLPQDARPNALGQYRRLVSFGARSFALWTRSGQLVYDSGDQLERITSDPRLYPPATRPNGYFNTTDDNNSFDNRSPRRGPQPLGVATGKVQGRTYAFVGLRKQGGIIVADLTDAPAAVPLGYFSTRDFFQNPGLLSDGTSLDTHVEVNCERDGAHSLAPGHQSDLGPEGVLFIPAGRSPKGDPLLVVNYDTSGSTRIYRIDRAPPHS